jgi:hypothetical protein
MRQTTGKLCTIQERPREEWTMFPVSRLKFEAWVSSQHLGWLILTILAIPGISQYYSAVPLDTSFASVH